MAAAAAAAAAGGLINLRHPHPSPPPRSASLRFGASHAPCGSPSPPRPLRPRRHGAPLLVARSVVAAEAAYTDPEAALLEALLGVQGRGRAVAPRQLQEVESAVQALEALGGVPDPTSSSLIEGSWQLIFTTRPGTASPIQRTFVGVDSFRIFQEVYLRTDDPRVVNVVRFSESVGDLKVEAQATIEDGKRILFRFDRAAFTFKFLPFKVPYPVPFRLLGDEAKGWLDTTYLSHTGNIRISRGNKGTTFVLQKSADPRQTLLSAISAGTGVKEVIDDFTSSKNGAEVDLNILVGEWQLLWGSQTEGESWSSIASAGLKDFQIIIEDGQLKNLVNPFPGVSLNARGNICKKGNSNTFSVSMNEGAVQVGGVQFPLDTQGEFVMEILYIDSKIRISRLNQHMLVHLRIANTT
ncbi:probable plastid-lipid-associated protein 12, chloroplastic isoform X1 [Phragmites australis]|uniref:probable plastid-lipid-associated protein 12, chloroplastic isoform X1 n=2 Tax=Phragmites australis TaxID=29695 RepID=UPI002D76EF66|nr:probable plastid-lipid-associated protein 12, chloroplastic isoform X1 [Phragmites australis]